MYARGKYVWQVCMRCGLPYPYNDLTTDEEVKGLVVCRDCRDPEHPQEHPDTRPDPIALRRSSPDPTPYQPPEDFDDAVFQPPTYTASGSVTIFLYRMGLGFGAASVNYATANGTALAGVNYVATSGTASWLNGELGPKAITIPLLAPGGQFFVNLSAPVKLEADSQATITVT